MIKKKTALQVACEDKKDEEFIQLLIKCGSQIDLVNVNDYVRLF